MQVLQLDIQIRALNQYADIKGDFDIQYSDATYVK